MATPKLESLFLPYIIDTVCGCYFKITEDIKGHSAKFTPKMQQTHQLSRSFIDYFIFHIFGAVQSI